MHKKKIVHRDLKPENILFTNSGILKVIDFGTSLKFNKKMTELEGTPYYVAPEMLEGCYDEKCDIWSIGVIFYIILIGSPPFNGNRTNEIL